MQQPHPYLTHVAQDLEWVISSPFLTLQKPLPDFRGHPDTARALLELTNDPTLIASHLAQMKRHNLGTYFETLVFYWLQALDGVQILAQNLQIRSPHKTHGELDLIFAYEDQTYHWELSIKFYANLGDPSCERDWVGPLKKDNLGKKLDRMMDHQIPLLRTKEARAALIERHLDADTITSSPFVKGILFHRNAQEYKAHKIPDRISPDCLQSRWFQLQSIEEELLQKTTHYAHIPKLQWMSGTNAIAWRPFTKSNFRADIQDHFDQNERPRLIAFGQQEADENVVHELGRSFIMPGNWVTSPRA